MDARELHAFLEVGRDFSNWIKDRIDQYDLKEREDYVLTVAKVGVRNNVTQKDYHLTLDTAKELSMVERNQKGKEARKYLPDLEQFGQLAFQMRVMSSTGVGQPTEIADLNERQATGSWFKRWMPGCCIRSWSRSRIFQTGSETGLSSMDSLKKRTSQLAR